MIAASTADTSFRDQTAVLYSAQRMKHVNLGLTNVHIIVTLDYPHLQCGSHRHISRPYASIRVHVAFSDLMHSNVTLHFRETGLIYLVFYLIFTCRVFIL